MKVVSFDIFDTLLVRSVGDPSDVFRLVAEECRKLGLIETDVGSFFEARIRAERLARFSSQAQEGECSLPDIYEQLADLLGLDAGKTETILQRELEIEDTLLHPNPQAMVWLMAARKEGANVVYVSDMYLPSRWLAEQLVRKVGARPEEPVFVSHEWQASKKSGRLFKRAMAELKVNTADWRHVGNDRLSDYKVPISLGMAATWFEHGNLREYERRLQDNAGTSGGAVSSLAGAARLARLEAEPLDGERMPVVAGALLPFHYLYSCWIIATALRMGLKRLHFVSRDCFMTLRACRHIASSCSLDLDCRYLYGSRQAWHLAGLRVFDSSTKNWLLEAMDGETFSSVLARVGLTWEEWVELCPRSEPWPTAEAQFSRSEREHVWHCLTEPESAAGRLALERAGAARALLLDYLHQEKVLGDEPCGVVDVGWKGRTRRSLEGAIGDEASIVNLHWLYFGLMNKEVGSKCDRTHSLVSASEMNAAPIPDVAAVAESLCLADHGSVRGYTRSASGQVVPVFADQFEAHLVTWGRQDVMACFDRMLRHLRPHPSHWRDIHKIKSTADSLLRRFCAKPTKEEADLWGDFPYEHDQGSMRAQVLAPPAKLGWNSIRAALTFGRLDMAAKGANIAAWSRASWLRRKCGAALLLPLVAAGWVRVHGPAKASTKVLGFAKRIFRPRVQVG